MTDNNTQSQQQSPEPNPALKNLGVLVGEWDAEGLLPLDPPAVVHGQASFEWLEDRTSSMSMLSGSIQLFSEVKSAYSKTG
jgi:hypothetical protein